MRVQVAGSHSGKVALFAVERKDGSNTEAVEIQAGVALFPFFGLGQRLRAQVAGSSNIDFDGPRLRGERIEVTIRR